MVPKSGQLSGDGVPQGLVLPVPVLVMTSYPSGSPREDVPREDKDRVSQFPAYSLFTVSIY